MNGYRSPSGQARVLARLEGRVRLLAQRVEKMRIAEYMALLEQPARLFWLNFVAGTARGVGIAFGFTVLGAMLIMILRSLNLLNLPVVGGFIADIVRIVQQDLSR